MKLKSSLLFSLSFLISLQSQVLAFPSFTSSHLDGSFLPFKERDSIPDPLALLGQQRKPARDFSKLNPRGKRDEVSMVPDQDHPYIKPGKNDQRSPCPGLNTLANHGYIPRSGIVHANEIIEGAQKGLNMGFDFATILALFAVYTDGDVLTQMVNIGGSTAQRKGLNNHGHFEGDASLSREDYYFNGQNYQLNRDRYQVFKSFNDKYGGGNATLKSMIEYRYQRFQDSRKDNPQFQFAFPRYAFSYGEAALVLNLFSNSKDGMNGNSTKAEDLDSFFLHEKIPEGFYPISKPYSFLQVIVDTIKILAPRFVPPGQNIGDNYVPFGPYKSLADLTPKNVGCGLYESIIAGGQTPSALQGLTDPILSAIADLAGQIYKPAKDTFDCSQANVTDPSLSRKN